VTAEELLRMLSQHPFEGLCRPPRGGHEMVHLLVIAGRDPRRERLDALALTGPYQSTQVERRPVPTGRMSQDGQERLQPAFEFTRPSSSSLVAHERPAAGVGPRPSEEVAKQC
jgi:hypothetical protein